MIRALSILHSVFFILLLSGCFFTNPPADEPAAAGTQFATLDNYRSGRAELYKAVEALGGSDALGAFQDLRFDYEGYALSRGQSANPEGEYYRRGVEGSFIYDAAGRILHRHKTAFRGGREFAFTRFNNGTEGWTHRLGVNEISDLTPFDIGFLQNIPQQHAPWTIPHSLVGAALSNPASVRLESDLDSPSGEVRVSFATSAGLARTLVLDSSTWLPDRVQMLGSDPLIGDIQREVRFSDYRQVGGLQIPHRLTFVSAGEELEFWTLSGVAVNTSPEDNEFGRPQGQQISLPPSFQPQRVAEGIYAVRLFSGMSFSYNTMLVVSDDDVTVVEAPLTDFFYPVVKGIAEQIAPGKPIKNVISTHSHFDHVTGLKAYMAAGANVYTVSDNARQLQILAKADHTLQQNPLRGVSNDTYLIHIVQGRHTIKGGSEDSREIQLIDIGPNPHVDQMLVVYVPDADVMFVADVFTSFTSGGFDAAPASLIAFADKLNELGLKPATFVPAHGPVVSWGDFERSVSGSPALGAAADD